MLKYILYRLLIFIPMLLVISLAAFYLSLQAPDDPVDLLVEDSQFSINMSSGTINLYNRGVELHRQKMREELNLDKPLFYVSIRPLAIPDTLFKIKHKAHRESLHQLTYRSGNWEAVQRYYREIQDLYYAHATLLDSTQVADSLKYDINFDISASLRSVQDLQKEGEEMAIRIRLEKLSDLYQSSPYLKPLNKHLAKLKEAYSALDQQASRWKLYVPALSIYGSDNQYHHWLKGVVTRLDFGISYTTKQKVSKGIGQKIGWSFLFALLSSILAYTISIPLGIWAAYKQDSYWDKSMRIGLFTMDAIPSFWMAYLLILIFANTDILAWFPASFNDEAKYARFVLPLIAYTYGGVAFLSRQVRISMISVSRQAYILAARARGISEKRIWLSHILKNALLPMLTIFGGFFPALVGGSVILEKIFSIPGMGQFVLEAVDLPNLPVIIAVFTLLGAMTMIGYLVSDILYKVVDPRIRFA